MCVCVVFVGHNTETVLLIFLNNFQAVLIAQMLSIGGKEAQTEGKV